MKFAVFSNNDNMKEFILLLFTKKRPIFRKIIICCEISELQLAEGMQDTWVQED